MIRKLPKKNRWYCTLCNGLWLFKIAQSDHDRACIALRKEK